MASGEEDAKNLALLFFMDHLMQKNGTRTIHDLSCQFGARGFTQEMRDAVGSTQEGLCDFLRQYPSLFSIADEDTVTLNGYGEIASGGLRAAPLIQTLTRDRDIQAEAVEFFETKLKKFGPELQIKSLLGHRSQAAPEIRMYSGRHVKDFTEFLQMHSEHFVVEGDRVRLTHMPEPNDPQLDLDDDGQPLIGQRAKQVALEYLKELIEVQETPMPMETLYQQFCTRFSHQVRQEIATNPKELMQFLKLHRHLFFIRSNKVSIVKNRLDENGCEMIGLIGGIPFVHDHPYSSSIGATEFPTAAIMSDQIADFSSLDTAEIAVVLKTLNAAREAVQEIAAMYTDPKSSYLSAELSNAVALDFKLVNFSLDGSSPGQEFLALITLATPFGRLYIFDVANSSSILLESGLKDLLEADDYVKVIHDCKRICGLLWKQYQISVQAVFDTQIANAVLQHQRTGRPLHEIRPVPFLSMQRVYYPQSLVFAEGSPKRIQKRDPKYWSLRPMTDDMIRLAVEEVHALMPVIFVAMHGSIKLELFELFWHLCRESAEYFVKNQDTQPQRQTGSSLLNGQFSDKSADQSASNQTFMIPSINNGSILDKGSGTQSISSNGVQKPATLSSCSCHCHRGVTRVDAEVQTVQTNSTGDMDSDQGDFSDDEKGYDV